MVDLAPDALAGRGDSGCSENGEKAEKRAFEDGLSPNGALTAIMPLSTDGLWLEQSGCTGHRISSQAAELCSTRE